MVDPVSLVSVAFQATKIGWYIYQFLSDAQSAPANIRHAHEIITGLETTLQQVNELLQHRPNPPPPEKRHHESIANIVSQCGKALQCLEQQLPTLPSSKYGEDLLKKWKIQVKAVLNETEVENIVKRIDKWNQMLQLGLNMLSIYSSWETQQSTEQTHILVQRLLDQQNEANKIQADSLQDHAVEAAEAAETTETRVAVLDDEFINGIEDWKKSVHGVVKSVMDTESVRIPPTISVEEHGEPLSPRRSEGQGILETDDQRSTTTVDSGVHMPVFDLLEPGRAATKPIQVLECMMKSAQRSALDCMKKGLPQKAVEYQKKYMAHRQQLSPGTPLTFAERSEMEETLAEIYMCMGTLDGTAEATKILHNLVEQEVGLPEAEQDRARKGRLYHRLSKILLDLGRPESMQVAALYAERAFEDRLSLEPRQLDLLKESSMLWYQALLKVPAPDEAEGLNDYTEAHLGFSIKPELTTHHDAALEWCQNKGFDADCDGFRFDVCDSRVDSPVKGLSPLHVAVMEGDKEILKHMVACAANLEIPERKDFATPLLLACTRKDRDIVKLCLEKGAKVDARDQYDKSGLHRCQTAKGGTEVAKLLLESDVGNNLLDTVDSNRETALYMASQMGNKPMVALLLEKGASPNMAGPGGSTALIATVTAAMEKDKKREIVQLLLQHGADPWRRDSSGNSAIDLGNESIRALIKRQGVPPRRRESTISTITSSSNGSEGSRGSGAPDTIDTISSRLSILSGRSGSSVATTISTHPSQTRSVRSGSRWLFKRR